MPAASAQRNAPAEALSLATSTKSAGKFATSRAASSAARLLPRPEASTAMRRGEGMAFGFDSLSPVIEKWR
jgi:hypothetical protein